MIPFRTWFPVVRGDYLIVKHEGKTYGWTCPYDGTVYGFDITETGISIWGIAGRQV